MIQICRATDLWLSPKLAASMYADRRRQFGDRLGWPVRTDFKGYERDEYDALNPVYVILEDGAGNHAGSLRLLPTIGRTMIREHFRETLHDATIAESKVWECTRFCLAPQKGHGTSLALLAATARLMMEADLERLIAIFDPKMIRFYRRCGVPPEIIGSHHYKSGEVFSGYWHFQKDVYARLLRSSSLNETQLELAIADFSNPWVGKENLRSDETHSGVTKRLVPT